ncbi:MAG: DUF6160 family protein [Thalassolituus sp.]|jgi:hypothetical protein|uniref:DUF6160 domain-containing protein n=2 Tax=root TaxID=1 RepID=M5DSM6_9GAMM|nr:DUF6160 family protein [Thalassolituus oleivorans]PHQ87985.1 MAG: hypothetical protein COB58_01890 [Thalassobium sp.]CCU72192.1 hypothetical protein TOL_1768 [Thalassolituus oleivorans MIL-1]|tara:strand:+ start:1711 stop:2580 length:870 start_codon:yes stop_codon:yes gene_type:complete
MKKIAFSLSVLAASLSAHAELSELGDYDLTKVTGQAGVDIELDLALDIGSIVYTDTTDGLDGDGGSLSISTIHIGGGEGRSTLFGFPNPGNTANIDDFKFIIDIDSTGKMVLNGSPTDGISPVDFEITVDEVFLSAANGTKGATLVDGFSVYGGALYFKATIEDKVNAASQMYTNIQLSAQVGIEDMDIDLTSMLGLKIDNMVVAGAEYFETIEENGSPTTTSRVATLRANMFAEPDGSGFVVDFSSGLSATNVFDIYAPEVSLGGQMLGAISLDDVDIRGVSMKFAGH